MIRQKDRITKKWGKIEKVKREKSMKGMEDMKLQQGKVQATEI